MNHPVILTAYHQGPEAVINLFSDINLGRNKAF